jgi:hypothetical protein
VYSQLHPRRNNTSLRYFGSLSPTRRSQPTIPVWHTFRFNKGTNLWPFWSPEKVPYQDGNDHHSQLLLFLYLSFTVHGAVVSLYSRLYLQGLVMLKVDLAVTGS